MASPYHNVRSCTVLVNQPIMPKHYPQDAGQGRSSVITVVDTLEGRRERLAQRFFPS